MNNMEHEILGLIDRYWKFDNDQTPVSNWQDKQDLLEAVRKVLRQTDLYSLMDQEAAFLWKGKEKELEERVLGFEKEMMLAGAWHPSDRPFKDYPIGTKAQARGGGYWIKTERGWKWSIGATFPIPGGDWTGMVSLPHVAETVAEK